MMTFTPALSSVDMDQILVAMRERLRALRRDASSDFEERQYLSALCDRLDALRNERRQRFYCRECETTGAVDDLSPVAACPCCGSHYLARHPDEVYGRGRQPGEAALARKRARREAGAHADTGDEDLDAGR